MIQTKRTMTTTVAYCRVSTEEQAVEGFSIEGQADKLRDYAKLHDLGEVIVMSDPGLSGKDTNRPGLQQILQMITEGEIEHLVVWRLDRLSRNLLDLILIADHCGQHNVALHSFTEKLDLSSPTGRMFYNILGAFAQFYREQLAENVRMGMAQAMKEGRWCNRPPTGYDLINGLLVPNEAAATVRRVFRMRADGASQRQVSEATGVTYSTTRAILHNRAYLGEIRHKDRWLPGIHPPLVTAEEFAAAHRGRIPGRRRGRDLMSGKVICGLCDRRMSIDVNGQGQHYYRCKHRGQGCRQPARSNRGLLRAAQLGLSLLYDNEIRTAIRNRIDESPWVARRGQSLASSERSGQLTKLRGQRTKLLQLHYDNQISADQFGEEQTRLTLLIENIEEEIAVETGQVVAQADVAEKFESLVALLDQIDIKRLWGAADDIERRALLDELIDDVTVHPDRLQVHIFGVPLLNVTLNEVGLKDSGFGGVGGGLELLQSRCRPMPASP